MIRFFFSKPKRPIAVPLIISLNVAVYIAWILSVEDKQSLLFMIQNFLVSWSNIQDGRLWTLLTSVFSHNMLLHFLMNMFVLNSFGRIIEITLGSRRFLSFYLAAGLIGSLGHTLASNLILDDPSLSALGASGAISGLVLLFALLYPREKILLLGLIPISAIWGAVLLMGIDLWGLFAQAGGGGLPIGHGAHLGGALTGLLYYFTSVRPKLTPRGSEF